MYNNIYEEYINNMIGRMPRSQLNFQDNIIANIDIKLNIC